LILKKPQKPTIHLTPNLNSVKSILEIKRPSVLEKRREGEGGED
jgi:hypothetical protein